MGLTYFKRYRMEVDLAGRDFLQPVVPRGYVFLPWDDSLLAAHAEAKHLSFRDEIDADVFPCFGELTGCERLMREIAQKEGFLPRATWLAVCRGVNGGPREVCGTVQGIRDRHGWGAVQNLGITPLHRKRRLGTSLLCRAFRGFVQAGLRRVHLEVTAENEGAIRLYHRIGFRTVKTVFKAVEVAYS
ncbi:MAG: GNAT family N-acetyltransferase [Planctomycetota bacterium]